MSSKLNVTEIIRGHFSTLKSTDGKVSLVDIATFVVFPIAVGGASIFYKCDLNNEFRSLLLNFGSIFTALLLSVLVLVYDQEGKYEKVEETDRVGIAKRSLLRELYYNISFSVVCAITLVIFSILHAMFGSDEVSLSIGSLNLSGTWGIYLITPIVATTTTTVLMNVLMIVKRMHVLLTS